MDWDGREVVAASDLEGLRIEPGVTRELPVDDGHDAALGTELGQEFTKDAIALTVKPLDLAAEPQIGHYLGRDRADGAKRAAGGRVFRAPHQTPPSPVKAKPEAL